MCEGCGCGCSATAFPRADLGVFRVMPDGLQVRGEADDPVRADRLLALSPSPAVVPVNALVEVAGPDLAGAGGQHMRDPVAEHMLRDDLPVRVVENRVAVRAAGPPPAPSPGHQEPAAGHRLDSDMRECQVRDRRDRCQFRGVHGDARGHRPGRGRDRGMTPCQRDSRRGHSLQGFRCRPHRDHFLGLPDRASGGAAWSKRACAESVTSTMPWLDWLPARGLCDVRFRTLVPAGVVRVKDCLHASGGSRAGQRRGTGRGP